MVLIRCNSGSGLIGCASRFAISKGGAGIEQKSPSKSLPPQKHAELHFIPPGQRNLDGPGLTHQRNRGFDDGPYLGFPGRAAYRTVFKNGGFHLHFNVTVSLDRVNLESSPRLPFMLELIQFKNMQRRGTGPTIHLGLDGRNTELIE